MKTLREVLLEKHQAAEPKLDGIREQVTSGLAAGTADAPARVKEMEGSWQAGQAAETIWINSLNYQGGVAIIQFTGNPNKAYILQAKDSLDAAGWNSFSTNQASATGIGVVRDADAKNTRRVSIVLPHPD